MLNQSKIWKLIETDNNTVKTISKESGISSILAGALAARNIVEKDKIEDFLNPSLSKLNSPFLLKDMNKAVEKIISVVKNNGRIIIYGDYDVDGVTSTALLYNYLKSIGGSVEYFIPDRLEEGYGLNMNAVEEICKTKPELIITVDCGISGKDEVIYINQQGIDIIITDHHECPEVLPDAYAVINPKQKECKYPFKQLAGVGVAFKLIQALSLEMSGNDTEVFKYLDIVSLGTVADIVPLTGENRILVKNGLKIGENTSNIGLRALCEEAGVKSFDTWNIGYIIAPRINAAGRLGCAERAVELLVSDDPVRTKSLAVELILENKKRQEIEAELTQKVIEIVETENIKNDSILVIAGDNWHHGVIGIVASKITEKYNKPCILISFEADIGRGSGRSIDGINLFELLQKSSHLLEKFGGHEMAGGITVHRNNLNEFIGAVKQLTAEKLSAAGIERVIDIDVKISADEISLKNIEELNLLEPYGMENPAPLFMLEGLRVVTLKTVGDNKHLKFTFNWNGTILEGIGFRMGEFLNFLEIGSNVDVVCSLEINSFRGRKSIQLNIKDIRTSIDYFLGEKYFESFFLVKNSLINDKIIYNDIPARIEKAEQIESIMISGRKNLFLINTPQAAQKILNVVKSIINPEIGIYSIYHNKTSDMPQGKNVFVINPKLTEINFNDYDSIILCDAFFKLDYYATIMERCINKKIFIIFDRNDLQYYTQILDYIKPNRAYLEEIFRFIKKNSDSFKIGVSRSWLSENLFCSSKLKINYYILTICLSIFEELNLMKICYDGDIIRAFLSETQAKVDLQDSTLFNEFNQHSIDFQEVMEYLNNTILNI